MFFFSFFSHVINFVSQRFKFYPIFNLLCFNCMFSLCVSLPCILLIRESYFGLSFGLIVISVNSLQETFTEFGIIMGNQTG